MLVIIFVSIFSVSYSLLKGQTISTQLAVKNHYVVLLL